MKTASAILGTSLLLGVLIVGTVVAATFYKIPKIETVAPSTSTIVASTSSVKSTTSESTELFVRLIFPNRTESTKGILSAGPFSANGTSGAYPFPKITPGNYTLSLSGAPEVYLPPTTLDVSLGSNYANVTVYKLNTFLLYDTNGLTLNGTQPGPPIQVANGTAVRIVLRNNTTLIHNIAVVKNLSNTNSSNIMFDSTSQTLNAGGTTNDTFVVTIPGSYYYADLIGNYAHDGEWGFFLVLPNETEDLRS